MTDSDDKEVSADEHITSDGSDKADGAEAPSQKPRKKRTAKSYAVSFFIKTAVTALAVWVAFTFIVGVYICHSNSAYPAIRDGELCLVYRRAKLSQGVIVVYEHDGRIRFGRVIAFGGDKVEIENDSVLVNGFGLYENVVYPTSAEGSAINYPYYVPDNSVFVLNDYRSDLSDSRTYGGIELDEINGEVIFTMRTRGI